MCTSLQRHHESVSLGTGTFPGVVDERIIEFIKRQVPGVKWLLSVCTGAELVARAGLLTGRNATTNKAQFRRIKVTLNGLRMTECASHAL